jgi:hypothetical protein
MCNLFGVQNRVIYIREKKEMCNLFGVNMELYI